MMGYKLSCTADLIFICYIILQMKNVKDIVIAKMDATANGAPPNYSAGGYVMPLVLFCCIIKIFIHTCCVTFICSFICYILC